MLGSRRSVPTDPSVRRSKVKLHPCEAGLSSHIIPYHPLFCFSMWHLWGVCVCCGTWSELIRGAASQSCFFPVWKRDWVLNRERCESNRPSFQRFSLVPASRSSTCLGIDWTIHQSPSVFFHQEVIVIPQQVCKSPTKVPICHQKLLCNWSIFPTWYPDCTALDGCNLLKPYDDDIPPKTGQVVQTAVLVTAK